LLNFASGENQRSLSVAKAFPTDGETVMEIVKQALFLLYCTARLAFTKQLISAHE